MDVFDDVLEIVLRGRRNTFATFSEHALHFRGRRSTLNVSSVIFRGRRSSSDVSCIVFIGNRIGTAVRSGDRVQIAWQARHFATCAEMWRKASQYLWGKLENLCLGRCY